MLPTDGDVTWDGTWDMMMMVLQRKTCTLTPSLKMIILHAPKKKQNESRSKTDFHPFQENGIQFPSVHCLSGPDHRPRRKKDIFSSSSLRRIIPILIHLCIFLQWISYCISPALLPISLTLHDAAPSTHTHTYKPTSRINIANAHRTCRSRNLRSRFQGTSMFCAVS